MPLLFEIGQWLFLSPVWEFELIRLEENKS